LAATPGKRADERERVDEILKEAKDHELLRLMRDETTVLVLMVRIRNEARRDEWEARMAEQEAQDVGPLFGEEN